MAPSPVTEDYYAILEVAHDATLDVIVKSYKRLALKLHPDRNRRDNTTAAFQLLGRAYDTLRDAGQRREYDLIYPSITRKGASAGTADRTKSQAGSSGTSSTAAANLRDANQIAALEKSKAARTQQWRSLESSYGSSIFDKKRSLRRLQQEIENLAEIAKAEQAEAALKNSWGTWLMSPFYKAIEESEEEKERKERARQERRIEKDMKERRLELEMKVLKNAEEMLVKEQGQFRAAIADYDRQIRDLNVKMQQRLDRERRERERKEREKREAEARAQEEAARLERERWAQILKQRQEEAEKLRREAVDEIRRKWEEEQTAKQKRWNEEVKHREKMFRSSQFAAYSDDPWEYGLSTCNHGGWWDKVQGAAACPECDDVWRYLLKCPGCAKKACPKCQSFLRPRRGRY